MCQIFRFLNVGTSKTTTTTTIYIGPTKRACRTNSVHSPPLCHFLVYISDSGTEKQRNPYMCDWVPEILFLTALCLEITSSQTAFVRHSILLLLLGTGATFGVIYNYYIVTVNVLISIMYKYTEFTYFCFSKYVNILILHQCPKIIISYIGTNLGPQLQFRNLRHGTIKYTTQGHTNKVVANLRLNLRFVYSGWWAFSII